MTDAYQSELTREMEELKMVLREGDVQEILSMDKRQKRGLFAIPVMAAAKTLGILALKAIKYKRMAHLRATVKRLGESQEEMCWLVMEQTNRAMEFRKVVNDQLGEIKAKMKVEREEMVMLRNNLTIELSTLQEKVSSVNATMIHLTSVISKLSTHVMAILRDNVMTNRSEKMDWGSDRTG